MTGWALPPLPAGFWWALYHAMDTRTGGTVRAASDNAGLLTVNVFVPSGIDPEWLVGFSSDIAFNNTILRKGKKILERNLAGDASRVPVPLAVPVDGGGLYTVDAVVAANTTGTLGLIFAYRTRCNTNQDRETT